MVSLIANYYTCSSTHNMNTGIHIHSCLVVCDDKNIIGKTKTTRKLVCWTSLILLDQKKNTFLKFSYEFPAFCPLVIHVELLKNGWRPAAFFCNKIIIVGPPSSMAWYSPWITVPDRSNLTVNTLLEHKWNAKWNATGTPKFLWNWSAFW